MIVIDASALLEILLHTDAAETVIARMLTVSADIHAPHLIDLEVAQVIRRFVGRRSISASVGAAAIEDLAAYPIRRHAHDIFLPRIWELRDSFSAYDAAYLALAEMMGAPLLTRDRRLGAASGGLIQVEVV